MRPDNSYIFWLEPLRDGFNTEAGVRILWLLLRQTLKRFANCKTMPFSSLSSGKYRYLQQCYNVQWTCYFLFFFNVYVYYCWFSFERQRDRRAGEHFRLMVRPPDVCRGSQMGLKPGASTHRRSRLWMGVSAAASQGLQEAGSWSQGWGWRWTQVLR